jgi:hypothetical protein
MTPEPEPADVPDASAASATGDPQTQPMPPTTKWATVVVVWVLNVVGATCIGIFAAPATDLGWLAIAMGLSFLVTMCIQLATKERRGFITRMAMSVAGSFVILAIATLVLVLVK